MSYTTQAEFDELRSVAFGSITGAYLPLGAAQEFPARIIKFTNTTDQDVLISNNGSTNKDIVTAGGFVLYDITTNHRPVNQDDFCFRVGTQWSLKYVAAPSKGAVYLSIIYAIPTNA